MKVLIIILLIGFTATSQYRVQPLNDIYQYFQVGSGYAVKPHTNNLIINGILTAGVRYKMVDVSISYEYVDLIPEFHAYSIGVQVIPVSFGNFEMGTGIRYGKLLRNKDGTFDYYGVTAETRYTFKKRYKRHRKEPTFFIALCGRYEYRGDIHEYWEDTWKDSFVESVDIKLGIKL